VESIIAARTDGSPFASIFDFCRRVDSAKANRRVIESLIDCGAFDFAGVGRARLAAAIDAATSDAARFAQARDQGQASLFDFTPSGAPETTAADPPLPDVPPWNEAETLKREKESLGLYLSGHPLSRYAEELARGATVRTSDLESVQDGKEVSICGIVSALKERTAKKTGEKMATFTIEDLEGNVDAIIFPELYRQAGHLLAGDAPILVTGQVAREENGIKIRASGVREFTGFPRKNTARIDIRIRATGTTADELARLREILRRHRGTCPVFLHILQPSETRAVIAAGEDLAAVPSDPLVGEIESLLGNGSVSFA
ncbi:MAG: DNA polymerase III subunit alpha, partial [Nitrospirae bacterium]|nr:DNA polymerase III subunit alpha [Nitrospirota bacterium]